MLFTCHIRPKVWRCLILLLLLVVWASTDCDAQHSLKKTVSLKVDQVPLSVVIDQLQQQAGVSFFYSLNAIGAGRRVSCQYEKVALRKVLYEFFAALGIQYKVIDDQIILYPVPTSVDKAGIAIAREGKEVAQDNSAGVRTSEATMLSGKITNEEGVALGAASVVLTGTQSGTISNETGEFRLETGQKSGVLEVSHAAYKSTQVRFGAPGNIGVITLQPRVREMDEVVVVGYGVQSRRDITNATSTIKGRAIDDAPVSTVDAALQGRASGVYVTQQSGSPGSPVRIQVRGTSSISSGTEPLYIIDGAYIFQELTGVMEGPSSSSVNPLAAINPDDIASIEILKDAAATAIYGARGANGVILITTKQGRKDQGKLSVSLNRGFSKPIRLIDYASGAEWLAMVDEGRRNTVGFGIAPGQELFNPLTLVSNTLPTTAGISGPQFGPNNDFTRQLAEQTNTNWRDKLLQPGSYVDLKMSASNGFDRGNFYLSGQYWNEDGILVNQRLQRLTFRSNLDFSPAPKWRIGARMAPSLILNGFAQTGVGGNGASLGRINTGATGGWGQANLGALPIMPVYNANGTYFDPLRGRNVIAGADASNFSNRQQQDRFLGNVYTEFKPNSMLTLRAEIGADFLNSLGKFWVSDEIRYNRYAAETGSFIKNLSATVYGTFQAKWKEAHSITGTAGAEWQKSTYRRQNYAFEGLTGNQQEIGEISSGSQSLVAVSGIFPDQLFSSLFVRGNYSYGRRYLVSGSLRRDGSSVFSPNVRFGYFPSVSAGWILSNERWFHKSAKLEAISFVKLRASYGQTGNAAIPSFAYQNNYINWPVYGQSPALSLSVLGNPNIRWEKNIQLDAALELGLWNNRIQTSLGGFVRTSQDMLLNVPVAPTVGIGAGNQSVIINIGNLRNKGIEWELTGLIVDNLKRKGKLKWTVDVNVSWIRDKVISLADNFNVLPAGDFPVAVGIMQGAGITQISRRLGAFYLAEYAGLDKEGFETIFEINKDVLRATGKTVRTGRVLRATMANLNNNRMVLNNKSGLPKWYGGITQSLHWLGFEMRMHVTFQGGNYIYDGQEENVSYIRTGNNVLLADLVGKNWSPNNPNAPYPRLTWNMRDNALGSNGEPSPQTLGTRTTRFLYKGDFVRLKTLSISYALPSTWVRYLKMKSAKIYVSGQNLLTFTAYPGFDPEILITGPGTQGRNLNQGFLTSAPVPQVKTLMFGMNIVL